MSNRQIIRGVNHEALKCRDLEVLMDGPAGTGKSRTWLFKCFMACEKYPGARIAFVRNTKASMAESTLELWENHVLPHGHPAKTKVTRRNRQSYMFPNGSEIAVFGLDDPEKTKSMQYDIIYVNEVTECFEEDYELLLRGLRNNVLPYQQLISDCNPSFSGHWVNQRAIRGQMVRFTTRHEDNPAYHTGKAWTEIGERYLRTLENMTGATKQRLRYGKWVSPEGAIFEDFGDAHHVDLVGTVGLHQYPVICGLDWGIADPFACTLLAVDRARLSVYMALECYAPNMTTSQQSTMVRRMLGHGESQHSYQPYSGEWATKPKAIFYDPAMNNRGPRHGDGAYGEPPIEEFRRSGLSPLSAGDNRDRLQNLAYLQDMVKHAALGTPDRWKLYIDRERCPRAWKEFEGATWKKLRSGIVVEDTDDPDHAITATYYALRSYLGNPTQRKKPNIGSLVSASM